MGIMSTKAKCGYIINTFCQPKDANEFYTLYEEVEYIFDHLTEDFTNKIIYCPFDSDESNFVKYIKANKDKLKYKEFWYTSDDWYNHLDLIEKADYIISNPPFSELINHYKIEGNKKGKLSDQGILRTFTKMNKKYLLFGCILSLWKYKHICNDNIRYYRRKFSNFMRPDGSLQTHSSVVYITNLNNTFKSSKLNLTKPYKELDTYIAKTKIQEGLFIKRLKDIPYDYNDWMFVPVTICLINDDRIIYDAQQLQNLSTIYYRHILNSPNGKTPYIHLRIKIKNTNNI